jgi:hypothetical protein
MITARQRPDLETFNLHKQQAYLAFLALKKVKRRFRHNMTLPLTPASVVRGLAESPCTVSLLAYSAELHPIGEQPKTRGWRRGTQRSAEIEPGAVRGSLG